MDKQSSPKSSLFDGWNAPPNLVTYSRIVLVVFFLTLDILAGAWGENNLTMRWVAAVLFIIAASTAFSWVFTISGASKALVDTVIGMNLNAAMFCLVVAVILLIFGTFMEGTAIAVLLVPVLWPIAQSMGINVVHFGMIVCISNVVGTMTPPVAVNIYSAATVSKLKMGEIAKAEIPFLVGYVGVFFLCVFSEWFCTFLT